MGVIDKWFTGKISTNLREMEEVINPTEGVKGVVDRVPPDEGCEVLDGEVIYED